MSTKIRKLVHQHLYLNKERIIKLYEMSKIGDDIYKVDFHLPSRNDQIKNIYITSDDERIMISKLDTGEEWRIPKIMIMILSELDIKNVIESNSDKSFDKTDNLIIILNDIAINYLAQNEIYMISTLWNLLDLIAKGDLDSKWFRDEMYKELGIISSYITYSSPSEYNNY